MSCGRESDWLCSDCLNKHKNIISDKCFICAKIGNNGLCQKCRKDTGLDGLVSIFPYREDFSADLIYSSKYYGYHDAIKFIIDAYKTQIVRAFPGSFETIGFTPQTKSKTKERGFNPAELIANEFSDFFTTKNLFIKTKDIPSQTKLTRSKRKKNVQGAYAAIAKKLPENLIITDDVITTGATIGELAKVAKKHGTKRVWALTICHG